MWSREAVQRPIAPPVVNCATIDSVIDNLYRGLCRAVSSARRKPTARKTIVFQLDTPGGDLDSTRKIVSNFSIRRSPSLSMSRPRRAGGVGWLLSDVRCPPGGDGAGHEYRRGASGRRERAGYSGHARHQDHEHAAALMRTMATQRGRNATGQSPGAATVSRRPNKRRCKRILLISLPPMCPTCSSRRTGIPFKCRANP